MYVILIVLTDLHPYWLTDVEHPSFEMRPAKSSLVFTCEGLAISNALQASARQNHTLSSFTITLSFPKLLLLKICISFMISKIIMFCNVLRALSYFPSSQCAIIYNEQRNGKEKAPEPAVDYWLWCKVMHNKKVPQENFLQDTEMDTRILKWIQPMRLSSIIPIIFLLW